MTSLKYGVDNTESQAAISPPSERTCTRCGRPKGCIPFLFSGKVQYWHLLCFIKMKKEQRRG